MLSHEPLLQQFRSFRALMKRVRGAAGSGDLGDARRRSEAAPRYTLDHIIRQRYPRFRDAMGDLDDALCLLHLVAALPARGRVTAE